MLYVLMANFDEWRRDDEYRGSLIVSHIYQYTSKMTAVINCILSSRLRYKLKGPLLLWHTVDDLRRDNVNRDFRKNKSFD